ncbi:MAG: hypothetical protein ABI556_12885 [Gemmatimonadales bacterium]
MAQDPVAQQDSQEVLSGPQRVAGQVVRPGTRSMLPVPNVWVTLHRVGSDRAAPLDSARADTQGHYAFDFTRTGDQNAIYFVSASYGGVAYFTPPLAHSTVRGEEAEIAVFDTTSGPVPIGTRGHHVIVSAVDASGTRTVTEVYELANDSSVTRVAPSGDGAVWSAPFPVRASSFRVSQGDIPAQAVRFANGRANIYAPIAPGLKQFAFSYSLPANAFPLSLPIVRDTQILEVLLEEEKGTVSGAKLTEKAPVAIEQRSFRRFLADDVPANSVSVIDLPAAEKKDRIDPRYMIALTVIIGGSMIFALARALRRR